MIVDVIREHRIQSMQLYPRSKVQAGCHVFVRRIAGMLIFGGLQRRR